MNMARTILQLLNSFDATTLTYDELWSSLQECGYTEQEIFHQLEAMIDQGIIKIPEYGYYSIENF